MTHGKVSIGVDIGGTKIRGIIFDGNNVLKLEERQYRKKPPSKTNFFSTLWGVMDILNSEVPKEQLLGIGIGTAGVVGKERIFAGPTLGVLNHINLKKNVEERYGAPVKVVNDVQSAIVAEQRLGAGRSAQSVVMIIVSTGVGAAHIKDGKLQNGAFDSAYAFGYMIVDRERVRNGERGDLEAVASAQFFTAQGIDPQDAERKARGGDRKMLTLWKEFGENLGIGIANIINLLEPELVICGGGGLSNAWDLFAPSMEEMTKSLIVSSVAREKTKILPAELGTNAGVIGAALLPFDDQLV